MEIDKSMDDKISRMSVSLIAPSFDHSFYRLSAVFYVGKILPPDEGHFSRAYGKSIHKDYHDLPTIKQTAEFMDDISKFISSWGDMDTEMKLIEKKLMA